MILIVKLSKTAWNNVIIFSVMIIILLINATNDRLFPENSNTNDTLLLPEQSVILALTIELAEDKQVIFERVGRAWKMTSQGILLNLSNQQIEQLMFTWQQSRGLVQAAEIVVEGVQGVKVAVSVAAIDKEQIYTLYSLTDQLLIYNHQSDIWLAFPAAINHQLIPSIE